MLIKGPGVSEHDHVVADWGCGGCCVCPGLARWRWEGRTVERAESGESAGQSWARNSTVLAYSVTLSDAPKGDSRNTSLMDVVSGASVSATA